MLNKTHTLHYDTVAAVPRTRAPVLVATLQDQHVRHLRLVPERRRTGQVSVVALRNAGRVQFAARQCAGSRPGRHHRQSAETPTQRPDRETAHAEGTFGWALPGSLGFYWSLRATDKRLNNDVEVEPVSESENHFLPLDSLMTRKEERPNGGERQI